jgi:hypothetical protein
VDPGYDVPALRPVPDEDEATSSRQWGVDIWFVAGYVRRELENPHVRKARMIDVSRAIDRAWSSIAPGPREDGVTADLNAALEREIRHNEDTFVAEPEGR